MWVLFGLDQVQVWRWTERERERNKLGVVKLVMLADAEDEAGALVAVDVRERDAHNE